MCLLILLTIFDPPAWGNSAENGPKMGRKISILSCTRHKSKTKRSTSLILVSKESPGPVDVPFDTFDHIWPTGMGPFGPKWAENGRKITILFCTRHNSKTKSSTSLILVSKESPGPVDLPFDIFDHIWPTGMGQFGPKWAENGRKISISACTRHNSKTKRSTSLILVSRESPGPVDVPFDTFDHIWPTGMGRFSPKWTENSRKISI